ncbi:MAG: amino acid ABC transporter ATP-binding protein [Candidatus Nanopelagicales bacterium]|nr:amino acid ABC transporter ATP-binding protein [Candidatus Nanopelagicales bacterium]
MTDTLIDISGVWKAFDDHSVLRGLDLSVDRHEAVVLIGASGSGKSTLLRCVNGLENVDAGHITLDGNLDVTGFKTDMDVVRRRIGIVFQSYNLFPHMTVLDNVTLSPRKVLKRSAAECRDQAMTLLQRFGLAAKASDYPDRLSGGQAQRVAIVRALAMEPELMLFDEITSALDPLLVGEVLDTVRELKEGGLTLIMATHEMGFAREVADRVCFLDAGVVLEQGTPAAVFGSPQEEKTKEFLARILK